CAFRPRNGHVNGDSIRFKGMRNGSKKIVYEVYGNYIEGFKKDAGKIWSILAMTSAACKKESLHSRCHDRRKLKARCSQIPDSISQIMVEAAGVEPASESIPPKCLHAYSAL